MYRKTFPWSTFSRRSNPVAGTRPPQALVLDSNIMDKRKLFTQKWRNYSIITNLSWQTPQYLLLHTLGDDALRAYNGFSLDTTDDNRTVKDIFVKFDTFAIGEVNETYERFVFNKRNQKEGETFEAFHVLGDHIYMIKEVRTAGDQNREIIFTVHWPLVNPVPTGNWTPKTIWSVLGATYHRLLQPTGATEGLFFLSGRSPSPKPHWVDYDVKASKIWIKCITLQ